MSAFLAVLWKELQETVLQRRGVNGQTVPMLILIALGGVAAPLLLHFSGNADKVQAVAITSVVSLVFMVMAGVLYAVSTAVDAVAGERERHTLETLVASPASDGAIVFGKIGAIVLVGFLAALALALVSSGTLIVMYGLDDAWPHLLVAAAGPFASVPASLFMASLGFLISYKAKTVKSAQSILGLAVFPIFMVFGLAAPLSSGIERLGAAGLMLAATVIGAAGLVATAVLAVLAVVRFRRDRVLAP